ncbi:immune inhibitor A domain-containing protein [Brevibacillus fluminis]|uniref:immune inhibitor A domain-containing protein n=1 Tax=Brevibacillus fluminis TaxID=511487 RepID=UPI003F88A840
MKRRKVVAGLLSTALIVGVVAGSPVAGAAKTKKKPHQESSRKVDMAVVNQDRLERALKERGELGKNASPEEVKQAIENYVQARSLPFAETDGIDTSSDFGKEAYKSLKGFQENAKALVDGDEKARKIKASNKVDEFVDRAAVALVEFPDFNHNRIEDNGVDFWTKDFNQAHYQGMLFNKDGYTSPEGKELLTFNEYYREQSAGSWSVDGVVTPWIMARENAAYYGGNNDHGNDSAPRELVVETLADVGAAIAGHEDEYDQRDPYDIDGDGNVMEPDGMLDSLLVVHAGVDESAGGGELGDDAIWAHRSTLDEPTKIPGTSLKAYDYIIQPEDGTAGVFAHEYGHNLGLPDEYDTGYTGNGEPVGVWSIMSAGSWAGVTPGAEPPGFSPWAKLYFHEVYGGNWPEPKTISSSSLKYGKEYKFNLNEAVANTSNNKILKIDLPDRGLEPPTQPKGTKAYFSTKGNSLDTKLTSHEIDLTGVSKATLTFDSWRQIEEDFDYLYVNVYVDGEDKPEQVAKFSDTTKGEWETSEIDLSAFAGKKIKVEFNYVSDVGLALEGFYVDNIVVTGDGKTLFEDDAEGDSAFDLDGFQLFDGSAKMMKNYYLIEWRSHNGVDQGLAHYRRADSLISYDPGMLVWYYDSRYGDDNMVGNHPGEGFLGVVDSHQRGHYWDDGTIADTRYQLYDAAFGKEKKSDLEVVYPERAMSYKGLLGIDTFNDQKDYTAKKYNPDGGKILPVLGLQIKVQSVKADDKGATIVVTRSKVKK